jgi:hypothetical protein
MIKEEKILISINARNISHYRELGYELSFSSFTEKINLEVPIEQVSKSSKERITAICDICSSETNLSISKYWRNYERGGYNFYSCFSCKNKKKEMTNIEKYGVASYSNTEEFKEKFEKSCLEKYGVSHPSKLSEFRDKIKETCLKRYGYTHAMLSPEVIESNRIWMSSEEFKAKSKETLINKYGVDSFSKTNEFKKILSENKDRIIEKMKQTFLGKYGVEHFSQTDIWKKKFIDGLENMEKKKIETCLERYGVNNVSKVPEIMNKMTKTKIDKDIIIDPNLIKPWEKYKREVRKLTNRNIVKLYENWDGKDFYDGESIKKYLGLSHVHRFYPTIDHKISVFYGFKNGISTEEIGAIDNLCITKRYINSIKRTLIDSEFIEKHKFDNLT